MADSSGRKASDRGNGEMHIVTNPNAGKHTSHAGIGLVIGTILSQPKNPNKLYDTKTLSDLEKVAKEISGTRPSILAIAGGDGTIHHTISQVLRQRVTGGSHRGPVGVADVAGDLPDIALIPIGTMNMVATAVGSNRITLPPKALAQRIVDKLSSGFEFEYAYCRVMKINGEYGFMYGTGLPVHLLERYYDDSGNRGGPQAAKVILGSIWRELVARLTFGRKKEGLLEPIHAAVHLPGNDPPCTPLMTHTAILAATIDQLGLGCRAMPDAMRHGQNDGKFLLRSTGLSYLQAVPVLAQLWAGFPLPNTSDFPVTKAVIEFKKPAGRMIDGEMKGEAKRDVIEIGPLLRFITG